VSVRVLGGCPTASLAATEWQPRTVGRASGPVRDVDLGKCALRSDATALARPDAVGRLGGHRTIKRLTGRGIASPASCATAIVAALSLRFRLALEVTEHSVHHRDGSWIKDAQA
jgi:hypothetical protein